MSSTKQTTKDIEGMLTDVIIQHFADRTLVLITQLGKVGNLIEATIPDATSLSPSAVAPADSYRTSLPPLPPALQLTPLLGHAASEHLQTLHSLYAAHVATLVWTSNNEGPMAESRRAVIVGVALRPVAGAADAESVSEHERKVFHTVMDTVRSLVGEA